MIEAIIKRSFVTDNLKKGFILFDFGLEILKVKIISHGFNKLHFKSPIEMIDLFVDKSGKKKNANGKNWRGFS
jgi:hypothetical protein